MKDQTNNNELPDIEVILSEFKYAREEVFQAHNHINGKIKLHDNYYERDNFLNKLKKVLNKLGDQTKILADMRKRSSFLNQLKIEIQDLLEKIKEINTKLKAVTQ